MELPSDLGDKFCIEKDERRSTGGKIVYRANFRTSSDAFTWLQEYQSVSKTNWIVKEEFLGLQKVVFHKYGLCQLNSKNKIDGSKRNKKCPAALDILIKKVNRDTTKNDKDFLGRANPLPGVITFTAEHNHRTDDNQEALGFLRISGNARDIYYSYFNDSTGPGEARRLHVSKILIEEDGPIKLADCSLNPSKATVYYLHNLWRESEYGKAWSSDPLAKLREKVDGYATEGVYIHIDDENPDDWAVLVVTPIMQRVQQQQSASEIIFIDSTSSVESSQSTLTVVLAATPGGAVPIAVLIHNGQSTQSYCKAFSLLKKNYPHCFGNKNEPEVFMTDNSAALKGALEMLWPGVSQFLCHFHIGQSEWRWLSNKEHDVPNNQRQKLISILKKMMYSLDTEEFEDAKMELENCGHSGYKEHVEKELFPIKEQWVKMFRSEIIYRGHNTNNYAEASIRILKDIILSRTKAFNVTAMADFLAHVWEVYFEAKLLHFAYNRESKPSLKYKNLCNRMPPGSAEKVIKYEDNVYMVPSGNPHTPDLMYEVQGSVGMCSCPIGRFGAFCKHQALIHKMFGGLFPNAPAVTSKDRYALGKLALGERCPPATFFLGCDENFTNDDPGHREEQTQMQSEITINNHSVEVTADHENVIEDSVTSQEDMKALSEELVDEVQRVLLLGGKSSSLAVFKASVRRLTCRLKNVSNSNQAVTTMISLSARAACNTRKGTRISVQSTSAARRRAGVTRGSKRIASGRPSSGQPAHKKSKKRPHILSQSIKENKSHPKSHGR